MRPPRNALRVEARRGPGAWHRRRTHKRSRSLPFVLMRTIAANTLSGPSNRRELLDIDVNERAGCCLFVAVEIAGDSPNRESRSSPIRLRYLITFDRARPSSVEILRLNMRRVRQSIFDAPNNGL
jgi:hypothetical protein